jgi:hypothetical protein
MNDIIIFLAPTGVICFTLGIICGIALSKGALQHARKEVAELRDLVGLK